MKYQDLACSYNEYPHHVHTIPKTKAPQHWFYVSASNGVIYVESGRTDGVNSNIKGRRKLDPSQFETMMDIYSRRKQDKPVSAEGMFQILCKV